MPGGDGGVEVVGLGCLDAELLGNHAPGLCGAAVDAGAPADVPDSSSTDGNTD
ncbi:MAG TPA: hypothetical protein VJT73_02135 [Polyangiaceae bacterium]|nr:hypothetical protein [Polyangiaceae bacterium]